MARSAMLVWLAVAGSMASLTVGLGARIEPDGQRGGSQPPPVFRSSVDLVVVGVQVVDDSGAPVEALGPADFEVSIGGKRRRVVSADFLRSTQADGSPLDDTADGTTSAGGAVTRNAASGRLFMLAFDLDGMTPGDSRAMADAAAAFIRRLQPSDQVGLVGFPAGDSLAPSTDHVAARLRLATMLGSRAGVAGLYGRFNLSPSEIVDISADAERSVSSPFPTSPRSGRSTSPFDDMSAAPVQSDTMRAVQARECTLNDARCADQIRAEATAASLQLEARAVESLQRVGRVLELLSAYDGRKILVLFSSGVPTSDRPGGRPDAGQLPDAIARLAAATNTTIYAVYIDGDQSRASAVANVRAAGTSGVRDFIVGSRVLSTFSEASGGTLLRATTVSGDATLDRVLRETSSRYLLGVQPEDADRDGRLRELRVRVTRRGTTVRSRAWVIVPARS